MMEKLNQVLIIDDDEVNNLFCKIVIEHSGLFSDVHCCTNGPEALDYLESCIKYDKATPELILLDVNMPLMDGFEFLKEYTDRGLHEKLSCKVSMLSSSNLISDMKSALSNSFVIDYIVKPLSEDALHRVINRLNVQA